MTDIIARFQDLPEYDEVIPVSTIVQYQGNQTYAPVLLCKGNSAVLVEADNNPVTTERLLQVKGVLENSGKHLNARITALRALVKELNHPDESRAAADTTETQMTDMEVWFDRMVKDGIEMNASDMHITVTPRQSKVEFRVDGDLRLYDKFPRSRLEALCRTIYNAMAQADTKETSFDDKSMQAGQIVRMIDDTEVMIRYQSMTNYPSGFDVTLRLLPIRQDASYLTLEQLGFSNEQAEALKLALAAKRGAIIVAGETGSGKSTTLKNLIQRYIKRHEGRRKVRTIEDPVEYVIPGANQTSVTRGGSRAVTDDEENPFNAAIRASMRGDPDLIMIGEVRDEESASLLERQVQSGHKVMTTVHTGSAIAIVSRLTTIGFDRRSLATPETLSAILHQTLVPVLCPHCKRPYTDAKDTLSDEQRESMERLVKIVPKPETVIQQVYVANPGGCDQCGGTGIKGRTVCAEVILPDATMLEYIAIGEDAKAYRHWLERDDPVYGKGRTRYDHALSKIMDGTVSPFHAEDHMDDFRLWHLSYYAKKHDAAAKDRHQPRKRSGAKAHHNTQGPKH